MKISFINKKRQWLANVLVAFMGSSSVFMVALFDSPRYRPQDFAIQAGILGFVIALLFMVVISMEEKK